MSFIPIDIFKFNGQKDAKKWRGGVGYSVVRAGHMPDRTDRTHAFPSTSVRQTWIIVGKRGLKKVNRLPLSILVRRVGFMSR
jgi:hypothetical protein